MTLWMSYMNRLSAEILFNFIGRVITYVKRATRNYLVMFGNVANGDILIYCVLTFYDYYRDPRLLFWLRRFRRINIKVNLLSRLRRF